MTFEPINVARCVYNGMVNLHCSKREMLHMTPREYNALMDCYLEAHGVRKHERLGSIDDLP